MDQFNSMSQYSEQEPRRVSSVILREEMMERIPEDTVRYVEVPQIQEVIRHVPKLEIVEVEKRVPKYQVQYVDREVIIPHITYVDKHVEVPQIQETVREVAVRQVVDVPRETIRHVPKIQTKIVEQFVEVPGPVVEVPKPYTVENKVSVPVYQDQHEAVVVAQTIQPIITESAEEVEVEVMEYEPEIIPVEVQVPKAVSAQLIAKGIVEEFHRVVDVPAAHFNSLLRVLNPHVLDGQFNVLPWVREGHEVPFLDAAEKLLYTTPIPGVEIRGIENTPLGFRGSQPQYNPYQQQPQQYNTQSQPQFQPRSVGTEPQYNQPQAVAAQPQYNQPQAVAAQPQYNQPQAVAAQPQFSPQQPQYNPQQQSQYPPQQPQSQYPQQQPQYPPQQPQYPPQQPQYNPQQQSQYPPQPQYNPQQPQGYGQQPRDFDNQAAPQGYGAPAPQGYGAPQYEDQPNDFQTQPAYPYDTPSQAYDTQPRGSSRQPSAPGYSQAPRSRKSGAASNTRSKPSSSKAPRAPEADLSKLKAAAAEKKKTGCC